MQHGKINFFFRNVHTERFGAGPCMACDQAPKEKKNLGKNSWEKLSTFGKVHGKNGKIWVFLGGKSLSLGKIE